MGSRINQQSGLSRVEVLVLLLILSLTAALVLVGVARLRQEAVALSCRNNLKQLGIAVQNYHECMGHLPHLVDQGEGSPTGMGLPSAFHQLTPFIEVWPNLYRVGQSPPDNYHARSSVPFQWRSNDDKPFTIHGGDANDNRPCFLDPADATAVRLRDVPMTLPDGSTGYYATGSYAANGLMPWGDRGHPQSLLSSWGTAVLIAERPQVCRTADGSEVFNLWGVGFYSPHMPAFTTLTPTDPPGLGSTGQITPVIHERTVRIGRQDAPAQTPDFATPIQLIRGGRPCDPRLPGTPHPSGMCVVMGDGSVRVYGLNTDPWVFWSACVPSSLTGEPNE